MSLDQKLQLWNVIGTWLAGLATFAAVAVSLHLARQPSKVNLGVKVGLRDLVGAGFGPEQVVLFSIVNRGERPVVVTSIGWVIGRGKSRRYAVQLFGSAKSPNVPQTLAPAQQVDFLLFLRESPTWLEQLLDALVKSEGPAILGTLKVEVYTSVDQTTAVKPEQNLIDRLSDACQSPISAGH